MKYVNLILAFFFLIFALVEFNRNSQLKKEIQVLTEENRLLLDELVKTHKIQKELKSRELELTAAINKYALKSSKIKKDKVIQDLTTIRDELKEQAQKIDSIAVNYPNRVDEDLIKSLKYKLSL